MKRFLPSVIGFLLSILTANHTMAQCSLNMGNDTTVCVGMGLFDLTLGTSATIDNGTAPYAYTWSCNYSIGTLNFTASDFLSDTTLANPQLIDWVDDSLTFHIKVTDFNENSCSDSLTVFFCHFMMTLEDKQTTIVQGDTAQLYTGVFGNCEPMQWHWTPEYNISDPNVQNPVVWPDSTTYYVATMIDSAGCEVTDEPFEVYVNPLNTNDIWRNMQIVVFPNPMNDFAIIEISGISTEKLSIGLYDALGRLISQENISENRHQINRNNMQSGLYIYQLFYDNVPVSRGKLVME